jgi:hypothetical protein
MDFFISVTSRVKHSLQHVPAKNSGRDTSGFQLGNEDFFDLARNQCLQTLTAKSARRASPPEKSKRTVSVWKQHKYTPKRPNNDQGKYPAGKSAAQLTPATSNRLLKNVARKLECTAQAREEARRSCTTLSFRASGNTAGQPRSSFSTTC